jgi:hypothetical protein
MKMKLIAASILSLFMLAANDAAGQTVSASGASRAAPVQDSQTIRIARSETLQSNKGSAQYFTGSVRVQQLFPGHDPSRTEWRESDVRAWRAECLAYTPAWSNLNRDRRHGLDSAVGRTNRRDSKG